MEKDRSPLSSALWRKQIFIYLNNCSNIFDACCEEKIKGAMGLLNSVHSRMGSQAFEVRSNKAKVMAQGAGIRTLCRPAVGENIVHSSTWYGCAWKERARCTLGWPWAVVGGRGRSCRCLGPVEGFGLYSRSHRRVQAKEWNGLIFVLIIWGPGWNGNERNWRVQWKGQWPESVDNILNRWLPKRQKEVNRFKKYVESK